MSEPLLNVMKIMLLAGLYLFFIRVLWSVFSELRDPRTVTRKRKLSAAVAVETTVDPSQTVRLPAGNEPFAAASAVVPTPQAGVVATATRGQLVVVDPPELAGSYWDLGTQVTLGRAHTNEIMLDDTYVSTVHARIFLTNGAYFIEDLASRNGSTINGQAIVATTALVPGDVLQLGATTMEFS